VFETCSRRSLLAGVAGAMLAASVGRAQTPAPPAAPPAGITRLDPAFDALIDADAPFETIMEGFGLSEGPVWIGGRDGYLLVSDVPGNVIHRWAPGDGQTEFLRPSGYAGPPTMIVRQTGSNGLITARGGLVVADTGNRGLGLVDLRSKRKTMLATHFDGRRLHSPNDMVLAGDGAIYFSDPTNGLTGGVTSPYREMDFTGVYRLEPDGAVTLVDRTVFTPNGIALSPDERTLYVTAYTLGWIAFDLDAAGRASNRRYFNETAVTGLSGADGMKVDAEGNIWTSSNLGISVFTAAGKPLGVINAGGGRHSNCEFGADGYLYIAFGSKVARTPVKARRLHLAQR
jgi:gluconolactonase